MKFILPLFLSLLTGCSTMDKTFSPDKLNSEAPSRSLTLKEGYKGKYMMVPYELPKGEYIPILENKKGYFFKAPSSLTIKDSLYFPREIEGGIFWRRDSDSPEWIYYYKGEFIDLLKDPDIADKITINE